MQAKPLTICFFGLSITSSWGNGHATTFRSLIKELYRQGNQILFFERDVVWYASNRDLPNPNFCDLYLYDHLNELKTDHLEKIIHADFVIQGSFVPEGIALAEWLTGAARGLKAFYDIDTPVTLQLLESKSCDYLNEQLIPKFDIYLSFTGGSILDHLQDVLKSPCAKPLYCSVDPELYFPMDIEKSYDLGYLGTYSDDRQPVLGKLLVEAARNMPKGRFTVAGSLYPENIQWPPNVERISHLPPKDHVKYYNQQRFTLNVTRQAMIKWGYAPSVRLFEAMACGTPVISDFWEGLDEFFSFGNEILIAKTTAQINSYLGEFSKEAQEEIGKKGRLRILEAHTSKIRASELIAYYYQAVHPPQKKSNNENV